MATTNKDIITAYKAANNIPLTAPLYTYAAWMAQGYRVRKGEKCKHRVQMWRYGEKRTNQDGQERTVRRCFHKTMNLFTSEQVEKITAS